MISGKLYGYPVVLTQMLIDDMGGDMPAQPVGSGELVSRPLVDRVLKAPSEVEEWARQRWELGAQLVLWTVRGRFGLCDCQVWWEE